MATSTDTSVGEPLNFANYETILHQSFAEMFDKEELTDAVLICNDKRIRVHKFLLSATSSFFNKMFKQPENHNRLVIKNVSSENLEKVLEYIYKGRVAIDPEKINSFFEAAKKLSVSIGFKQECHADQSKPGKLFWKIVRFVLNFNFEEKSNSVIIYPEIRVFYRSK